MSSDTVEVTSEKAGLFGLGQASQSAHHLSRPSDESGTPDLASIPSVSVVAPMFNEAGGAVALVDEIAFALGDRAFEVLAVDDASTDGTGDLLKGALADRPFLRVLSHGANAGQSRALRTGILAAKAEIVITIDGDGQNIPADIPRLIDALEALPPEKGVMMVAGERQKREDSAAKRWASRAANGLRSSVLRDGARDTGCGLKAFYKQAYLRLPYFDHSHRYLPALMIREGLNVEFVPVGHRPRTHGASKYTNLGRLLVAFRDLLGVMWLNGRARSPKTISEARAGHKPLP
ncbi:MAG: glycosyltransferase family 2 protein [Pseudomonadota bacterium]